MSLTVNKKDKFMVEIVFEVLDNSMFSLEGRVLSDEEKDTIVALWNEFDFDFAPSVEELKTVWNKLYETL